MSKHNLVDGTLKREQDGIVARCSCGWSSRHFTSLSASAAFRDHQETAEGREYEVGMSPADDAEFGMKP